MAIKVYFVNDRLVVDFDCGIIGSRTKSKVEEFQISSYGYGTLRWGSKHVHLHERFRPRRTAVFTLKNLSFEVTEEDTRDLTGTLPSGEELSPLPLSLFALNTQEGIVQFGSIRVFYLALYNGEQRIIDYVPCLDATGTPCMYDKIRRTCFYNAGSGTFGYRIKTSGEAIAHFALRDPYYTAPSGVYARPAGENELEILADTDISPDAAEQEGYTWHPNTGDAYTAYNITPEPII